MGVIQAHRESIDRLASSEEVTVRPTACIPGRTATIRASARLTPAEDRDEAVRPSSVLDNGQRALDGHGGRHISKEGTA
jgi:hypothetical protein